MRGWVFAVGALVAIAPLAGCFTDDGGGSNDAALPAVDVYVAYDAPALPDTGSAVDATLEAGADAPPDVTADVPLEAAPEAGVDAPLTDGPRPCRQATDCPPNLACDTTTGQCGTSCGDAKYSGCNGGCCSAAAGGTCQTGTSDTQCGTAGLCASCPAGFATGATGKTCEPAAGGGACGCTAAAECPAGMACDTSTRACGPACGAATQTACNGGCCDSGRCAAGTASGACGADGATCAVCTGATPTCGNGMCTTACGQPGDAMCGPGTCCQRNACVAIGPSACGASCASCSGNGAGSACVNGACGCMSEADCPPGNACDTSTHTCGVACGGATESPCNGGCCDPLTGQCATGLSNGACGNNGAACTACANGTPTCSSGVCSNVCGSPFDGVCGGGTCCSTSGTCQPQGSATGCGAKCQDCTGNSAGLQCINNSFCGCNRVATDCPPDYACNIRSLTCTTSCNGVQYTACNGGCCAATVGVAVVYACVPGNTTTQCGSNGAACNNCQQFPQMTCTVNGTCQ